MIAYFNWSNKTLKYFSLNIWVRSKRWRMNLKHSHGVDFSIVFCVFQIRLYYIAQQEVCHVINLWLGNTKSILTPNENNIPSRTLRSQEGLLTLDTITPKLFFPLPNFCQHLFSKNTQITIYFLYYPRRYQSDTHIKAQNQCI